jgi:hypothetical protein
MMYLGFHPFYRTRVALRVSRSVVLLFLGPRHSRWGCGGQPHAPTQIDVIEINGKSVALQVRRTHRVPGN